MKKLDKKSIALSIASVATAATLLFGGVTYAYLQDNSEDVVNTMKTNKVLVDLYETKDGEKVMSNEYDIIPGATATKDPTVSVDNTVPAYVFVEITDTSNGFIKYELIDGWLPLEGKDNVYYRDVPAKANPTDPDQVFGILKNNQITFDKSIQNSDMVEADGKTLKAPYTLTFKAFAIQQEGFESVQDAWLGVAPAEVATVEDFTAAIASGKSVKLTENIALTGSIPKSADKETEIDLGTKTLTVTNANSTAIAADESLTLKNGNIEFSGLGASNASIMMNDGGKLTLDNVNLTSSGVGVYPKGPAEITVTDSVMNCPNSYCVSTNASTPYNYNSRIHLQNSEFNGKSPILINVPCELIMDNCTVNGEMHGVIVRGGTAVLNNCTINNVAADNSLHDYFDTRNWGQGNTLNLAGITIGNKVADSSTSYQYPSNVTLNNTTVTSTCHPTIYIWGNNTEANGVTLNYDAASSVGTVVYGGGCAVVNGVTQTTA